MDALFKAIADNFGYILLLALFSLLIRAGLRLPKAGRRPTARRPKKPLNAIQKKAADMAKVAGGTLGNYHRLPTYKNPPPPPPKKTDKPNFNRAEPMRTVAGTGDPESRP